MAITARPAATAACKRAIQDACRETGQVVPKTKGELIRCAYESLALQYRQALGWLEELTGERIKVIHIVGGGSQNDLLNQFTADACQRPVLAGPVEATSIGNLVMQLFALGEIRSLAEGRALVRRSVEPKAFDPQNTGVWDEAYARFQKILSR